VLFFINIGLDYPLTEAELENLLEIYGLPNEFSSRRENRCILKRVYYPHPLHPAVNYTVCFEPIKFSG